ncbi:MAG: DUF4340 domain-containing protein [Gammaproteobacteria bacterium]|nr:DUF4340 domain-containing protein [Gammaproteobacteria bacterium]
MRGKSLVILAFVAVILVAAAMWSREKPQTARPSDDLLLPDLMTRINSVSTIKFKSADNEFSIQKLENTWGVDQKDGYTADTEKVRSLLLGMARTKRLEAKTKNPDLYEKLQLQDIDKEGAQSVHVRLIGDEDTALADVIFGKNQSAKVDPTQREYYVRVGDDPQSWLVQSDFDLVKDAKQWLRQEVLVVDESRIRSAEVIHEDGTTIKVQRDSSDETNYTLSDIPESRKIKYEFAVNDVANSFANLNMDDVVKADDIDFADAEKATMQSFDGLQISLETAQKDDVTYARLQAELVDNNTSEASEEKDENRRSEDDAATDSERQPTATLKSVEEVKQEIEMLNARWSGWAYQLPDFELNNIFKPIDELLEEIEQAEGEREPADGNTSTQN